MCFSSHGWKTSPTQPTEDEGVYLQDLSMGFEFSFIRLTLFYFLGLFTNLNVFLATWLKHKSALEGAKQPTKDNGVYL